MSICKFVIFTCLLLPLSSTQASLESWYFYLTVGGNSHSYKKPLNSLVDFASDFTDIDTHKTSLDYLGIYMPVVDERTVVGVVMKLSDRRNEVDADNSYKARLSQSHYGASMMHFFGREIGDGFFLRGDAGVSSLVFENTDQNQKEQGTGAGILLGLGYGMPVSREGRVLLGYSLSFVELNGIEYGSSSLTFGALW